MRAVTWDFTAERQVGTSYEDILVARMGRRHALSAQVHERTLSNTILKTRLVSATGVLDSVNTARCGGHLRHFNYLK